MTGGKVEAVAALRGSAKWYSADGLMTPRRGRNRSGRDEPEGGGSEAWDSPIAAEDNDKGDNEAVT